MRWTIENNRPVLSPRPPVGPKTNQGHSVLVDGGHCGPVTPVSHTKHSDEAPSQLINLWFLITLRKRALWVRGCITPHILLNENIVLSPFNSVSTECPTSHQYHPCHIHCLTVRLVFLKCRLLTSLTCLDAFTGSASPIGKPRFLTWHLRPQATWHQFS